MATLNRSKLVVQSLLHYWRTNLAVLLGVVAATAVVGGALIVGDSVRASLRLMTLERLGDIDYALVGPRFVREQFTEDLSSLLTTESATGLESLSPAIVDAGGSASQIGGICSARGAE